MTQILSLAVLLNLATDACQFCDNLFNPSLSLRSSPSFFVSAQFGGFGGGGGRRRHFGAGGGGRGPGKKEEPQEDYYKILDVPRDANEAQIKKKFKKLAIKFHPDKNKDDPEGAKKKFQKIALAYETLQDPDKRRAYDMGGEEAVRNQEAGGGPHMDMDDLFSQFFGGGGDPFGGRGRGGGGRQQFHFNMGGGGGRGRGGGGGFQDPFFEDDGGEEQKPVYEYLFQNTDVFQLNLQSISQFYRRKDVWIVLFYEGGSEKAEQFKEEYTLLAQKMYGIMSVGAIDCKEDEELCEEFSVYDQGKDNTIKIFTENTHDDGTQYKGKMEWKQIAGASSRKMQNFVNVVTNENYESFVQQSPTKNKILLFSDKKYTLPLYKSLSKTYKEKLVFGEVRKKNDPELFAKFGVSETPVILALTDPYSHSGEKFESGELKIDQLKKFLSTYAYREVKVEKKIQMHKLTYQSNKSPTSGVCGKKTSNLCLILFLKVKGSETQYVELLEKFQNDPVTIAFVYTQEEPGLIQQFGVDMSYGAVIFKPKRAKYTKLSQTAIESEQNKFQLIHPNTIKTFLDNALSGSGTWEKLDNKDSDLNLQEVILGGPKGDL